MKNKSSLLNPAIRSRNWSCITYYEDDISLLECISKWSNIRHFAFIYHDKDINDDNTPKLPHYHIALIFSDAVTSSSIKRHFASIDSKGLSINTLCEPTTLNSAIVDYFTHKNEPDKFQYDKSLIISDNLDNFYEEETKDNTYNIIDDMFNKLPLRELVRRYGRDFVYHYSQFKQLYNDICYEESFSENKKST